MTTKVTFKSQNMFWEHFHHLNTQINCWSAITSTNERLVDVRSSHAYIFLTACVTFQHWLHVRQKNREKLNNAYIHWQFHIFTHIFHNHMLCWSKAAWMSNKCFAIYCDTPSPPPNKDVTSLLSISVRVIAQRIFSRIKTFWKFIFFHE
jgi:hypothetical protein